MTLQEKIMQELNVKPSIEPKQEIEKRVGFLKSYLKKTGAKGFVLGISGGQDSTLAGRLAQLAVEELREEGIQAEFIAVRLPYGVQEELKQTHAADFIGNQSADRAEAASGCNDKRDKFAGSYRRNGIRGCKKVA